MNTSSIPSLSAYQNLDIPVENFTELPYTYKGESGTECEDTVVSGNFHVVENNHSSYFISRNGSLSFVDDNDKAINGVKIRLENIYIK